MAEAQPITVRAYDVLGRLVGVLFEGDVEADAAQEVVFEAGSLPVGVYVLRAEGPLFEATRVGLKTK